MKYLTPALLCLFVASVHADDSKKKAPVKKKRAPNPAMAVVKDDPELPRVLLIGDSISIGYTVPVREMLKGKANVHRPLTNCGPTSKGVAEIDKWLGDGQWDVIHFNWGLHDLKYMGPKNQNLADPKADDSHQQVPPKEYEANMRKLVARLKQTGAKLIWRNTTPVPKGSKGRVVGDSANYNKIAASIMKENNIPIDDQYSFALKHQEKLQKKANVHFSNEGSNALGKQAVVAITKALAE